MCAGDRQQKHGTQNGRQRPGATRRVEDSTDDEVGRGNRCNARRRLKTLTNVERSCWMLASHGVPIDPGGKNTGHQRTETKSAWVQPEEDHGPKHPLREAAANPEHRSALFAERYPGIEQAMKAAGPVRSNSTRMMSYKRGGIGSSCLDAGSAGAPPTRTLTVHLVVSLFPTKHRRRLG